MPKLTTLARIVKETGEHIRLMQPEIIANKNDEQELKPDGSIVTTADKAANKLVCAALARHYPGIAIVSEENPEAQNAQALKAAERFDTDPLDNTTAYTHGHDGYSVNIGRIKNGVPVEGAIYFPARKELYFTADDGKAYLQHGDAPPRQIKVRSHPLRNPLQAAIGYNEQHIEHLGGAAHDVHRLPGQLRTCMVARGECDITGINKGHDGGFNSWDTAGPHAVLLAAGGDIIGTDGTPMRYPPDTVKLPDHIAGSRDALLALKLTTAQALQAGRKIG